MLGHSHALSGLAVGAATLPVAPLTGTVAQLGWVAAVGGMAMLPDLDQRGSTISRMWGPLTEVPSGLVGRLTGGHRHGTHDAVLAPLAAGGLALAAAQATWASLLLLALAIGLALRALHVVVPGRFEETVVGNLVLSWGGAWLLLAHSPSPGWLPWAVALGVLVHIAGDFLTCSGVPVPLVWLVAAAGDGRALPDADRRPHREGAAGAGVRRRHAGPAVAEPAGGGGPRGTHRRRVGQPRTTPSARAAAATAAATASATRRSSGEGTM